MAETLIIDGNASKEAQYEALIPQIESLVQYESDWVANLANTAAALKQAMGFFWVGFYEKKGNHLVLGPFQGPIACTRIPFDKGVCGASYSQGKTLVVPDVEAFPGHIACSSESKSEIVVPLFYQGEVKAILDIDSDQLDSFDETDQKYLEQLMEILSKKVEA